MAGALLAPLRMLSVSRVGSGPWQVESAQLIGAPFVLAYSALPARCVLRSGDRSAEEQCEQQQEREDAMC